MPTNQIANYIFKNNGNGTFLKQTAEWGFDEKGVSAGAAYTDLDNDGDMDLVVNNVNDYAGIYRNNNEKINKTNYLKIKLQGDIKNGSGIGSKVILYCGSNKYYQEQMPVRGFQSSVDPVLCFGIAGNTVVDSVIVIWPNDHYQKLTAVKSNQTITMQPAAAAGKWNYDTSGINRQTFFSQTNLSTALHTENNFNDFTVQTLLPNYFSRQGPCIAVADINADGREDFFMGGAKGEPSKIFTQNANGQFVIKEQNNLSKNINSETVAAVFFDADKDGDNDLYAASGGYEFDENDAALQDRLYFNDGKGNYSIKENALPKMLSSKSCVKAADIDGDGDMDLFVGGRVVPGKYPLAPESYILLNDGKGNFTNATAAVCPIIKNIGMVTDAVWADVNNDKQMDLIVAGEWMPVKVFLNQKGILSDASASYIHFESSGWWNKINASDMDGDGDIDLIIGNCGSNTQFKVDEKSPMSIYYKDFDGNGSIDPVLCYYIQGVSYPAASRDDLTDQLPGLKKKFLEYKSYANATINDIFSETALKDAGVLKAAAMQTVYLENQGLKGFVLHQLPLQAQYAPVYGIVTADMNKDGKKDILLAGNNTWTRIKFGRYNANHGVLLLGDGKNNFSYIPQSRSGLKLKGNVRSLEIVNNNTVIAGVNNEAAVILKLKDQ